MLAMDSGLYLVRARRGELYRFLKSEHERLDQLLAQAAERDGAACDAAYDSGLTSTLFTRWLRALENSGPCCAGSSASGRPASLRYSRLSSTPSLASNSA